LYFDAPPASPTASRTKGNCCPPMWARRAGIALQAANSPASISST
jgi:hypothetical protein